MKSVEVLIQCKANVFAVEKSLLSLQNNSSNISRKNQKRNENIKFAKIFSLSPRISTLIFNFPSLASRKKIQII